MNLAYINGNVLVNVTEEGYKIRRTLRYGEKPEVAFPESLDIQLNNRCSNGCKFCYASSNPSGGVCDPDEVIRILSDLPPGIPIELALGGGNLCETPDEVLKIVGWAAKRGYLIRGTFNVKDMSSSFIWKFINTAAINPAIGISVQNVEDIKSINATSWNHIFTTVFHIILTEFPLEDIPNLPLDRNYLFLGYKNLGRGKGKDLGDLTEWSKEIKKLTWNKRYKIAFDNLALEQLGLKDSLPSDVFNSLYQGDEFTNTMFVDAVNGRFAPSSLDSDKGVSWNETTLTKYFNENKNSWL